MKITKRGGLGLKRGMLQYEKLLFWHEFNKKLVEKLSRDILCGYYKVMNKEKRKISEYFTFIIFFVFDFRGNL